MSKKIIETFNPMESYILGQIEKNEPSCWNGEVNVKKFRVIIEPIEEPREVIAQRLQTLWDNSTNSHHMRPLIKAANEIGVELKGSYGSVSRAKKKKLQ